MATPKEYARQNKDTPVHTAADNRPACVKHLSRREAVFCIARFLSGSRLQYGQSSVRAKEIEVASYKGKDHPVAQLDTLVNIGPAQNLLSPAVQAQIEELSAAVALQYVRMEGLCEETPDQKSSPSTLYPNSDYLMQYTAVHRLLPIFVLRPENLVSDGPVLALLRHYNVQFNRPAILIELEANPDHFDCEAHANAVSLLAEWDNIRVGYGVSTAACSLSGVTAWLQELAARKITPSFLSVSAPTEKNMENLYSILGAMQSALETHQLPTPVWVTSWNIQKSDPNPVGSFNFRAADLLETMLALSRYTRVLGFWLSSRLGFTQDSYEYHSLFYIGNIRRPIYFLLSFLQKLDAQRYPLQYGENHIASVGKDMAAVLVYVPYNKAEYDNDEMVRISNTVSLHVKVTGFSSGDYYCKQLTLDEEHGGVHPLWMDTIGFSLAVDREMVDYFAHINRPQMRVENRYLPGIFETRLDVKINDCVLIVLQKK